MPVCPDSLVLTEIFLKAGMAIFGNWPEQKSHGARSRQV
jgi:hypothetical protein